MSFHIRRSLNIICFYIKLYIILRHEHLANCSLGSHIFRC